jgi:hypothetical protein
MKTDYALGLLLLLGCALPLLGAICVSALRALKDEPSPFKRRPPLDF